MQRHCKNDPNLHELFNNEHGYKKGTDHILVCQDKHRTYTKEKGTKNVKGGEKWVGVLTFRKTTEGHWYIPIICTNVNSKIRAEYKGIGTALLNFVEHNVKEVKDGHQICVDHEPSNKGMKALTGKLGYHHDNQGGKVKTKGAAKEEKECKTKKRKRSPSGSDTDTTSTDGESDGSHGKVKKPARKKIPGTGVMQFK